MGSRQAPTKVGYSSPPCFLCPPHGSVSGLRATGRTWVQWGGRQCLPQRHRAWCYSFKEVCCPESTWSPSGGSCDVIFQVMSWLMLWAKTYPLETLDGPDSLCSFVWGLAAHRPLAHLWYPPASVYLRYFALCSDVKPSYFSRCCQLKCPNTYLIVSKLLMSENCSLYFNSHCLLTSWWGWSQEDRTGHWHSFCPFVILSLVQEPWSQLTGRR